MSQSREQCDYIPTGEFTPHFHDDFKLCCVVQKFQRTLGVQYHSEALPCPALPSSIARHSLPITPLVANNITIICRLRRCPPSNPDRDPAMEIVLIRAYLKEIQKDVKAVRMELKDLRDTYNTVGLSSFTTALTVPHSTVKRLFGRQFTRDIHEIDDMHPLPTMLEKARK